MTAPVAYLLDVDNTLLDNDRVVADLMRYLDSAVGHECQQDYWVIFERLRAQLGYADYLGALQTYRAEHPHDPNILSVSSFLIDYPFANRLFPNALDVIDRLKAWGPAVILTDGDVVFQPRKVDRSGLFEAMDGNVLRIRPRKRPRIHKGIRALWTVGRMGRMHAWSVPSPPSTLTTPTTGRGSPSSG